MFLKVHGGTDTDAVPSAVTLESELLALAIKAGRTTNATRIEQRMAELQRVEISERIRQARQQAGMTQEELADLLHVRARTIANYESGRVPFRMLNQIAELTGRSQEWLLHGDAVTASAGLAEILARLQALEAKVAELPTAADLQRLGEGLVAALAPASQGTTADGQGRTKGK